MSTAAVTVAEGGSRGGGGGGDWKFNDTHNGRFANLIATGFRSDFTLILGPQKLKVPVHKIILQAGSRVLDSNIVKSSGNELVIELVDPVIFKLALQYLYTGESGVRIGDAVPLLQLATDYEISELRDQCAAMLKSDFSDENVLPLFQRAMEYAHGDLIQSTLAYICRRGYKILQREEFADLRLECLIEVIQQDKLRVVEELTVFNAVYRWGEAECKRNKKDVKELRQVLEKPLAYIRFPLMDSEDFAINVATKNILDLTELTTLLTCFLVSPEKRNVLPQGRFVSTPRMYLKGGIDIIVARTVQEGAGRIQSLLSTQETLMICGMECVTLKSLSISKPTMQSYIAARGHSGYNMTYHYDRLLASVTVKCGDEYILQLHNQPLVSDGTDDNLLEMKFLNPIKFTKRGQWLELTIVVSGYIGYSNSCNGRTNVPTDHNYCEFVSTYSLFKTTDEYDNEIPDLVYIKRKKGDAMKMKEGLIEKLVIQN